MNKLSKGLPRSSAIGLCMSGALLAASSVAASGCGNTYAVDYVTQDGGGAPSAQAAAGGNAASTVTSGAPPACTAARCTLATAQGAPAGIVVGGGYVYWANSSDNRIMRSPIDGGSVTALATNQGSPWSVALTPTDVYWASRGSNTLSKAPIGGGTPSVVTSTGAPIAVRTSGSSAYWLDFTTGIIYSEPEAGGTPAALTAASGTSVAFAIDATAVYAGMTSAPTFNWAILATGATGSATGVLTRPLDAASDGSTLYWTAKGTTGGDLVLAQGTADSTDGAIVSMPTTGGSSVALLTGLASPMGISVDATDVYWTYGYGSPGGVAKMPKAGGMVTVVETDQERPAYIAVDDRYVYWTTLSGGTIERAAK